MIRFECDYSEGAHPRIMERLAETNQEQTPGYGMDAYCARAAELIRALCGKDEAAVHFMVGGTQTNLTVISSILRPHQGVVTADSGHINVHESGAVEATGHKVLPIASRDGKISAESVRRLCEAHWNDDTHEHMVQPGMVYLSNPTENGTIYSKAELCELSRVCREYRLPLFMDGARLGYGLAAEGNDLTIADIAELCDVFYIGGTKVGALLGEVLVIVNRQLQKDFRYIIKRHGGMLAKGRLLGVQFCALFEDGLYFEIAGHAVKMAMLIRDAFAAKGYPFLFESHTNQQFPIMPDECLASLSEKYAFSFWEKTDGTHST
ncbi:MAG: aminotransferase class I/II-fold pyridoxal phosphate-dependent enzyme, partial [Clostridia bacterium]|nr:aminotransferase class I/II-fold pyridoxal phosphate-dependent enzyme [Clostridia bacterium]